MEVVKITTPELSDEAHAIMAAQGHWVPFPTHVFMVGDQIRSAYSSILIPCVFVWFSTDHDPQPVLFDRVIKYIKKQHPGTLVWPIPKTVKPHKFAERLGGVYGGNCDWFMSGPTIDNLTQPI